MMVSSDFDEVQSVGGNLLQQFSHTGIFGILCAFETNLLLNFMATFTAMTYIRFLTDDSESEPDSDVALDTNENRRRAKMWFAEIIVRLLKDRTFSDLLRARKHQLGSCLASVSVISRAHSE
jgi:hypothetical protein